jgi:hypothetical protein
MSLVTFEAEREAGLMYLRQEWVSGEGDGVEFDLTCGAGLGAPLMSLRVTVDGQSVTETVNIIAGLTAWVTRIADEIREAPDAP